MENQEQLEVGGNGAAHLPAKKKPNFKNYDALNEEKEPFGVIVGGREIVFPKVLPAKVILDIERARANGELGDEDSNVTFGFTMIERCVGRENWDHIMEHVSVDQARDIVKDMMAYHGYGGGGGAEDAEEEQEEVGEPGTEAAAPAELASPSSASSSTSPSSTETSSASGPEPGNGTGPASSAGDSSSPASQPSQQGPEEASS